MNNNALLERVKLLEYQEKKLLRQIEMNKRLIDTQKMVINMQEKEISQLKNDVNLKDSSGMNHNKGKILKFNFK